MTRCASLLACNERRFDNDAPAGKNKAEAAMMEVERKADRERVNSAVYNFGDKPQRVCARFLWKLSIMGKHAVRCQRKERAYKSNKAAASSSDTRPSETGSISSPTSSKALAGAKNAYKSSDVFSPRL